MVIDRRGRPTVTSASGSDHLLRTCCLSVRPSTFKKNLAKQNNFQVRIVIATGVTMGLPEWIIDGTHVWLNVF